MKLYKHLQTSIKLSIKPHFPIKHSRHLRVFFRIPRPSGPRWFPGHGRHRLWRRGGHCSAEGPVALHGASVIQPVVQVEDGDLTVEDGHIGSRYILLAYYPNICPVYVQYIS